LRGTESIPRRECRGVGARREPGCVRACARDCGAQWPSPPPSDFISRGSLREEISRGDLGSVWHDCGPTHRGRHTRRAAVLGCRPNTMASAMASPWVQGIAAGRGRSLGDTARAKRRHRSTKRSMHHRISTQTNAGLLDALEVKVPKPSTVENVDEKNEFKSLMEKAGVRHQVRLASGSRGRGLFPTGPVGWTDSAMLLSVPLDVCICAPFGDEDAVANELGLNDGYKDTCTILRRAWQKRNGAKVPEAIVSLLDSDSGDDRELALALWVLWATEEGGEVWEAYAQWLPKPDGSMPSLLLADDKELAQLQDDVLAAEARQIHEAMAAAHKKIALANADAVAMKGRTCREFSLDELKWGFALVASRAVASPVGDGASAAAIMVPFFDMANHDDRGYVSAIKSVRGTEDGTWRTGYASRWSARSTRAWAGRAWFWKPRAGCKTRMTRLSSSTIRMRLTTNWCSGTGFRFEGTETRNCRGRTMAHPPPRACSPPARSSWRSRPRV